MASPDHWQAMQITDAAVFYARLTKWDESFDHLPPHTIWRQIWYPLGLQMARNLPSGGQFVVDISDVLQIKLDAIRAYATQFPRSKARVFQLVHDYNRLYGESAGRVLVSLLVVVLLGALLFYFALPSHPGDGWPALMDRVLGGRNISEGE